MSGPGANMKTDNYRGGYNAVQANAVATLVSHCAQAILTDFGMSSSSAFEVRVPYALTTYFGYALGLRASDAKYALAVPPQPQLMWKYVSEPRISYPSHTNAWPTDTS